LSCLTMLWVSAARVCAYASRFFTSVENLGFMSSVRLFTLYKFGITGDRKLFARKLHREVHFRGAADGVLSHFFYPGFHICDTPDHRVRFIIDAGANIGDETLRFRYFHPQAFIVALEPEPGNYRMLCRNVAGDNKIAPLLAGLWSHECNLSISPSSAGNNEGFTVSESESEEGVGVSAVSVRGLLDRFAYTDIDILKMDIEGAEYEVFSRNVGEWIDRVKVLIFECPDNDRPGTALRIFQAFNGLDFDCHIQGECIVMIRRDTGWNVESNLFLPQLPPHTANRPLAGIVVAR
jgi:FkbM family methyltransferase